MSDSETESNVTTDSWLGFRHRNYKFAAKLRRFFNMAHLMGLNVQQAIEIHKHHHPISICEDGLQLMVRYDEADTDKYRTHGVCLQTNLPISSSHGLEYFELNVFAKEANQIVGAHIGLSCDDDDCPPMKFLPGHEPFSFGFHGDTGAFDCHDKNAELSRATYGSPVSDGDVIGCGVDLISDRLFFTKNGVNLGVAYEGKLLSERKLYFTVGLSGPNVDCVLANFGSEPFVFNLDDVLNQMKADVAKTIEKVPLQSQEQFDVNNIVMTYLIEQGNYPTAELFARDIAAPTSFDDVKFRYLVHQRISDCRINDAIALINFYHPEFFKTREELHFRLLVQQFVDLFSSYGQKLKQAVKTGERDADAYSGFLILHEQGREVRRFHAELVEIGVKDLDQLTTRMKEAFALLAYNEPEQCPFSYLLAPCSKDDLWEDLNVVLTELYKRGAIGLKNVSLKILPPAVERGMEATLLCQYDLEDAPLYAVKWYRGTREFYRYSPNDSPPTKIFPYQGIHVDVSMSNASQVVLRQVGFNLSGNLSCEVTTDAPSFSTALVSKELMVIELPKRGPTILTEKERYDVGDILRGNCSSSPSRPPATLNVYINNIPVSQPVKVVNSGTGLQMSVFKVELRVEPAHMSSNGQLTLRCTANVGMNRQTNELSLGPRTSEPVPERVTSASHGSTLTTCHALVLVAFVLCHR